MTENETPVLWTEFRQQQGAVIREYTFAHLKGGQAVETAIEPIYAWTRFNVEHADSRAPEVLTFKIWLSKAFLKPSAGIETNGAALDSPLHHDRIWNPTGAAIDVPIYDADGHVRLIVALPAHATINLQEMDSFKGIYELTLGLPIVENSHIDLMVPMLVEPVDEANREFALGYEGALAECEAFWTPKPSTAVSIHTPENYVNQFFRRSTQLTEIVAEKSVDTGLYTFLTGSYVYDSLWSTPVAMHSFMLMDLLGYHDVVEQHIEIYRGSQGTQAPPGPVFAGGSWPGFLCSPTNVQAIAWISDHGAILELLAVHALITDRQDFIDNWTDVIIQACDFIKDACALTDHEGFPGLIPPAVQTDEGIITQGIMGLAWTYKGLVSAVRLLQRIKHPRADEFDQLAQTYRSTYADALREVSAAAPTWTDDEGNTHPIVPSTLTDNAETGLFPELVLLDAGALASTWAGLLPATDPLMSSFLDFFRNGPNTKLFDLPHHHPVLNKQILIHEQSSAEPCYSWNLFHSWELGDREHYLESMFGLFTGSVSQDTFSGCEHRNLAYGLLAPNALTTWAARHAVIDDDIEEDRLHLLRFCPLAWLSADEQTTFEQMPTSYGTVTLKMKLSEFTRDRSNLEVDFAGQWHHKPNRIVVHVPPVPGLTFVIVNGKRHRVDANTTSITI